MQNYQDDAVKPSRVNRRPKKKWRKNKIGLLNFSENKPMINPVARLGGTGLASGTSGTDRNQAVFLCAKFSTSILCRAGWASERVAGARAGRPTRLVRRHNWSCVVGIFNPLRDMIMNKNSPRAISAQNPSKTPVFNLYHHRQAIAQGVAG
jgi:hypothetical protein